jgi:hypothetical protein
MATAATWAVYPVAGLPADTLAAGCDWLVTVCPPPYDREAAAKLSGEVVQELEAMLATL